MAHCILCDCGGLCSLFLFVQWVHLRRVDSLRWGLFLEVCGISDFLINEQIHDKEVRVVDAEGEQLGIMSTRDAMAIAEEKKLDLVKIAPTAKPPVCRIMDYSKFRFDQTKKEKEARKKQRTVDLKEIRLSPNIEKHDIEVKTKKAKEFLCHGDKVKVTIRFRGREIGHSQHSVQTLIDFAKSLEEFGVVEKNPKMEGKSMIMFLTPRAAKQ